MGVQNPNSTNYEHPDEPNLLNLHKAMAYNNNGEPVVRTTVEGVTIEGNVNVDRVRIWDGTNNLVLEQPVNDSDPGTTWTVPTENHNMIFNGTTWDRMRGTIADGVLVQLSNGSIAVTDNGGSLTVDGTVTIQDGGNVISVDDAGGSITVDGTVTANINGNVPVNFPDAATTAFEELITASLYPEIQIDAVYGFDTDRMAKREVGAGTAGVANGQFFATVPTTSGSSAFVASSNHMRYRPGQGALTRLTASFTMSSATEGVQGARQIAGPFHIGEGYFFGFSGSAVEGEKGIGILHSYNGKPEIQTLTINTAPTGNQTATITLDSVAYTVSITAGTTAATAAHIAAVGTFGGSWEVDSVNSTITFTRTVAGPKSGTYSFSSSGTGTLATGTFTQGAAGVLSTNVWTYQSAWNGTAITFDPSKLNVYAIDFRWLGAGIVRFFMEEPTTGKMTLVHTQHWAGTSTDPHVYNPTFRLGWIAAVLDSPSQATTIRGASGLSAIQGSVAPTQMSKSWYALNPNTRTQNTYHHLLSIRNPYHRDGVQNTQEFHVQDLAVALQGTDPSVVLLFLSATPSVDLQFLSMPNSPATYSTTTATFNPAVDQPVAIFTVGINGSSRFDLTHYHLNISPGEILNIVVYSTNQITNSSVAVIWNPE